MTDPRIERKIDTLMNMVAWIVDHTNPDGLKDVEEIQKSMLENGDYDDIAFPFNPPLKESPKICNEDEESKQAETMLKVARKHLKKADFKAMTKDELKAWAKRMEQITDMNWEESHLKED